MNEYGDQMSLFDGTQEFKITNKIRLIELFAGYGSQSTALENLGANFEHHKISEWAVKSIQAYKDLHFTDVEPIDVDVPSAREWLKGRISKDYSTPLTDVQIYKMSDEEIRTIKSNMDITHNLGSVCSIKGKDLEITDTDKYTYIMTYSFPCQDLSLAGKRAGFEKGSGTRSGLLWEVERILDELTELPQVLIMENVPQVHSQENIKPFSEWLAKLESLGYKCYYQDLNAKNYGIPQNRERTFMVSILGDYFYNFPNPFKLTKRLKDMLEDEVDEKFYLSDRAINGVLNTEFNCSKLENRTENPDGTIPTLCARDYKDPKLVIENDGKILTCDGKTKNFQMKEYCGTLLTNSNFTGCGVQLIVENNEPKID